jgi:signal peptidase II
MRSPTLLTASSVPANLKPAENRLASQSRRRLVVFAALAMLGGGLDLLSKQWVFAWRGFPRPDNVHWLLEPYVGIETSLNPGALFGMGAGYSHWFALLSVVAAIGIVVWLTYGGAAQDRWLTIALGLVTGGIIGNLYDRLGLWHFADMPDSWRNNVRDWILFQYPAPWENWNLVPWPNFNIADSCLVIGAAILVVHSLVSPPQPAEKPAPGGGATGERVA